MIHFIRYKFLGVPQVRPDIMVAVIGDLHDQEGQGVIAEMFAVGGDQRFQIFPVDVAAGKHGIRLALIPDHAPDREPFQAFDPLIEQPTVKLDGREGFTQFRQFFDFLRAQGLPSCHFLFILFQLFRIGFPRVLE